MNRIKKYEIVINEALRSALQYDSPNEQISEFIAFLGKHIESDRIYIFEDNERDNITVNTYEWCADGVTSEIDNLQSVNIDIFRWWYDSFEQGKSEIIYDMEKIREQHPDAYHILKEQCIDRLVICPIRYKKIRGFFGVDNPPKENMSGLITFLDMISTLLISFLKMRNANDKSKREAEFMGYSALAQIYISMHYINVQTHRFHIIKTIPEVLHLFGRETVDSKKYDMEEDFSSHIYKVIQAFCRKDQMEYEMDFLNLDTVEERLKGKSSIGSVFYGKISGWCRVRFIPVDYDENGRLLHILYCVESIDEQRKREDKLLRMAQTDTMTGVCNRGCGEERIEQILNNKKSGMFCLIDCDGFKQINDIYGHMVGDKVLVVLADALQRICRNKDVIMRLGGDEFILFVAGVTEKKDAEMFFDRLFCNIKKIKIRELGEKNVTISLGACIYDGVKDISFDRLYQRADVAMYQSKKQKGYSAMIYEE